MSSVVTHEDGQVARPLKVLVPLIKHDLTQAREAVEKAGLPYYRAAGEKLLEAKGQMDHGEFRGWVERNFTVKLRQAQLYMSFVVATRGGDKRTQGRFSSLQEFRREHHGYKQTVHPQPWHQPVKDVVDEAKRQAERLRDEELTRQQERKAERQLALQLIDIGFKALASKLHPDKGGSRDAMSRLNRVRDRLKQHA